VAVDVVVDLGVSVNVGVCLWVAGCLRDKSVNVAYMNVVYINTYLHMYVYKIHTLTHTHTHTHTNRWIEWQKRMAAYTP